jgi:hypothetical protein
VKKLLTIFFVAILSIQVVGCYVYFATRLISIRHEMREQLKYLPTEELSVFTFTVDEFRKAKVNDHEIKVDGKMHDIARIESKEGQLYVYAVHDEAEDNLLAFLSEIASRSSKDKKPVPSQLLKLISLQFVKTEISWQIHSGDFIVHNTGYTVGASDFVQMIESPPPRG